MRLHQSFTRWMFMLRSDESSLNSPSLPSRVLLWRLCSVDSIFNCSNFTGVQVQASAGDQLETSLLLPLTSPPLSHILAPPSPVQRSLSLSLTQQMVRAQLSAELRSSELARSAESCDGARATNYNGHNNMARGPLGTITDAITFCRWCLIT